MKSLIDVGKAVFAVGLLVACGVWLLAAGFICLLAAGNHMDDGGCYAGHPGWASLQLVLALLGTTATGACVYFLVKDKAPTRAAWGFAVTELSFIVWRELLVASPHAQVIAATC